MNLYHSASAAEGPMKIRWVEVMLVVASPSGSLVLWLPNIDLAALNGGIERTFKRHTFKTHVTSVIINNIMYYFHILSQP